MLPNRLSAANAQFSPKIYLIFFLHPINNLPLPKTRPNLPPLLPSSPSKMRFANSTLLLRLLNVFLLLWLLFQLNVLLDQFRHWREYLSGQSKYGQEQNNPIPLTDQLLRRPLPVGSVRLEAIRLNELFARPQHKCKDRRVVGGLRNSFFVCFEPELVGEQGIFGLNWPRLKRPPSQFMPELEEFGEMPRDRIGNMLAGHTFDLAKLDLDTELLAKRRRKTGERIELLEWVLERLVTRQLLLTFRPGLDEAAVKEDGGGRALLAWYRLMFELYFRWKFALVGVRSNGKCGQAMQPFDARHCEWRASFVHFDGIWEARDLPAYGIGSPLEEKLRFLRHLLATKSPKSGVEQRKVLDRLPVAIFENAGGQMFDLFVYFRYRPFLDGLERENMENLLKSTRKLALFCPAMFLEDQKWIQENGNAVVHFDAGISPEANKSTWMPFARETLPSFSFPLHPLDQLLGPIQIKPFQRNVLLLDLDGAEWDVLGTLVDRANCEKWLRSFRQIAFRLRIWAMEESENWRRFLLWMQRLEEECQFRKAFAQQLDESTLLVTYKRVQIVGRSTDEDDGT